MFRCTMFGSKYQIMWQHILRASWLAWFLFNTIDARSFQPGFGRGQAMIINRCSFPIFLKSCINDDPLPQILKAGHIYRETYRLNPDGGGVAIKLASNQSIGAAENIAEAFDNSYITQFEYTYTPHIPPGLYYDISNVNGGIPWPFAAYGLDLNGTSRDCQRVLCPAGNSTCAAAYTIPTDDYATHGCASNNTLTLTLCSSTNHTRNGLAQGSCGLNIV